MNVKTFDWQRTPKISNKTLHMWNWNPKTDFAQVKRGFPKRAKKASPGRGSGGSGKQIGPLSVHMLVCFIWLSTKQCCKWNYSFFTNWKLTFGNWSLPTTRQTNFKINLYNVNVKAFDWQRTPKISNTTLHMWNLNPKTGFAQVKRGFPKGAKKASPCRGPGGSGK